MGSCQSRLRRTKLPSHKAEIQQQEAERQLMETCLKVHEAFHPQEIVELKPEEPEPTVHEEIMTSAPEQIMIIAPEQTVVLQEHKIAVEEPQMVVEEQQSTEVQEQKIVVHECETQTMFGQVVYAEASTSPLKDTQTMCEQVVYAEANTSPLKDTQTMCEQVVYAEASTSPLKDTQTMSEQVVYAEASTSPLKDTQTIYEKVMHAEASTSPLKANEEEIKIDFIEASKKISKKNLSFSGQKTKSLFQRKLQQARDRYKEQRKTPGTSPMNTQMELDEVAEKPTVKEFSHTIESATTIITTTQEMPRFPFLDSFPNSLKHAREEMSKLRKSRMEHKAHTEFRPVLGGRAMLIRGNTFDTVTTVKSSDFGDCEMIDEATERFEFDEDLRGKFPETEMTLEMAGDGETELEIASEY